MAKLSKLQKEIARRAAEIATLQAVLDALQDVQTATVKLKPPKVRKPRTYLSTVTGKEEPAS